MTMLYHYEFDWRLVVEACPEYEKYLKPKTCSPDYIMRNDDPFGDEDPILGDPFDDESDRVATHVAAPVVGPDEILPEDDPDEVVNYRTKDLDGDEMDIIAEMHIGAKDGVSAIDAMVKENKPREIAEERFLKDEYQEYPRVDVPTVILLAPPKKFLAAGSSFYTRYDIHYKISFGGSRNPDVVDAHYARLLHRHPKLTIINTVYRFDRRKDFMSEKTKDLSFTTYNFNTNRLYLTHKLPMSGNERGNISNRYRKDVRQSSLHPTAIHACINSGEAILGNKFHRIIMDYAKSIMPDIYLPGVRYCKQITNFHPEEANSCVHKIVRKEPSITLSAIMMQLRVGKPLPWVMDTKRYLKVLQLMDNDYVCKLFSEDIEMEDRERLIRNYKRRHIYKLINNLKKSPKLKTIAKTALGNYYRDLYYKMLFVEVEGYPNYITPTIPDLARAVESGTMPKSAYHFISHLINNYHNIEHKRRVGEYIQEVGYSLGRDFEDLDDESLNGLTEHHATAYVKFAQNLIDDGATDMLRWTEWRDTFVMAENLGIRVRPNKFKCVRDVRDIHDKLSEYQVRDIDHMSDYGLYKFKRFNSSTKEYEGFKFFQLMNTEELIAEGTAMHHCVGGYSPQCLSGRAIIFSMLKDNRSWVTIELQGNTSKYKIVQKYTIKDFTINNPAILKAIEDWHSDTLDMHKGDERVHAITAKDYYKSQKSSVLAAKKKENLKKLEESGEMDKLKRSINEPTTADVPTKRKELFNVTAWELAPA